MRREAILGVVLAGGEARRFGSDKAAALYRGVPMLAQAQALLAPFVAEVAVAGGEREGVAAIPDRPVPGLGPLGGLCGALLHAHARGYEAVLSVPCDTPDLPAAALDALLAAGAPSYLAALPVAGLWLARDGRALLAHLSSGGQRAVTGWTRACGATPVEFATPFANVNRPEDLPRA